MNRIFAALVLPLVLGTQALAQGDPAASYPDKPIKIIVSVPAGGGVDTVTRFYAEKLRQRWGQTVVVENRGGAAGNIAAEFVSSAPPDGYTLMASQPSPITTNKFLYKKLNFDPDALVPVAIMSQIANVLLVRPDFPAKTAEEFLAYAKANPGKLNYGTNGIGSSIHLYMELLMAATGTEMTHIPYKGQTESIPDRLSGTTHFWFGAAEAKPFIEKGQLVAIVTSGPQRMKEFPDTPTLIESGVNLTLKAWLGVVAPPGTPPDVITKLNAAFAAALNSAEVRKRFEFAGHVGVGTGPDEMLKRIRADAEAYAPIVRRINLKLD